MADLSLYRRSDGNFDLAFDGVDLLTGKSLESIVVLSLGSDGRVASGSFKNELQDDGWWGESTFEGDRWGSLLHTLFKKKNDPNVVLLARQYVSDCLKWIVEDGIADSVDSKVTKDDKALYIDVRVEKGNVSKNYRYEVMWSEVA